MILTFAEPLSHATPPPNARPVILRGCGGPPLAAGPCEHDHTFRRSAVRPGPATALPIVHQGLASPGQPHDAGARTHLEPRFGQNLSRVQVHADPAAASSAEAVGARVYTIGSHIALAAGEYRQATDDGRRLIAHQLAHVIQQRGTSNRTPAASLDIGAVDDPAEREADRIANELGGIRDRIVWIDVGHGPAVSPALRRQAGPGTPTRASGSAAPAARRRRPSCRPPAKCPADFCVPFADIDEAQVSRFLFSKLILLGIGKCVDPRVVPLWREHIDGGGPPRDLSSTFGPDFTRSRTTAKVTRRLTRAFVSSLQARPPRFAPTETTITVPLRPRIARLIDQLGRFQHPNRMNFDFVGDPLDNVGGEIPANLAGDIANNQTACPAGAQPSRQDDQRLADGDAHVTRNANGSLTVVFNLNFTVIDTLDLCPGNCGTSKEQWATVILSRWEASDISGDIPFTVNFPAPATTLTTRRRLVPPPPSGASPIPTPGSLPGTAPATAPIGGARVHSGAAPPVNESLPPEQLAAAETEEPASTESEEV
jgi:hypothetical protein